MAATIKKIPIKRNPAETRERLLKAGMAEFCSKGYGGSRAASICMSAKCNIRMLYHYYGGKKNLYLVCLDRVYTRIRLEERKINFHSLKPQEALEKLVHFTFKHMANNPDFVRMAGVENTQQGKFIKQLPLVSNAANELIDTVDDILHRGIKAKLFKEHIDPFQLYLSILSMSYMHLSNRHTISITYGRDITGKVWQAERRQHVIDMVLAYVKVAT